jgi:hypothetical protein
MRNKALLNSGMTVGGAVSLCEVAPPTFIPKLRNARNLETREIIMRPYTGHSKPNYFDEVWDAQRLTPHQNA